MENSSDGWNTEGIKLIKVILRLFTACFLQLVLQLKSSVRFKRLHLKHRGGSIIKNIIDASFFEISFGIYQQKDFYLNSFRATREFFC